MPVRSDYTYSSSNGNLLASVTEFDQPSEQVGLQLRPFSSTLPGEIAFDYWGPASVEKVKLTQVSDGRQSFDLNWPLIVSVEKSDDVYFASNQDFNLHEIGRTKEEALEEFQRAFLHLWRHFKNRPRTQFVGFGRRLKALFDEITAEG